MERTGTLRSLRLTALAFALWGALATEAVAQGSVEEDRAVLVEFYEATTDEYSSPSWIDSSNWNTEAPLGEWFGVTTNANGRVTGLVLSVNGLSRALPSILGNLSSLETLNLHGNYLSGPIPSTLVNLPNLETLDLSHNGQYLSGPIPSYLGNLSSLKTLDLSENALSGRIPTELGNLSNLVGLDLLYNELSGSIPSTLGNLSNLKFLNLAYNNLSGMLPTTLANLINLGVLYLSPGNEELCAPNDAGLLAWLESIEVLQWTGPTCSGATGPTPKPPAVVQTAVDDAIAAATNGDGLRTGGVSVTVPLDALFTFTPSAASAVTYDGATFSVSSTAPGVVSVSTTDDGPGVVLTPGADAGTATVTVDARPEGQPSASPVASVMFEVAVHTAVPALPAAAVAFLTLLLAAVGRRRAMR